ncbi:MAG: tRNA (adenosine(37)-N6)-threonylcarbamoyltransferase complex dimerization subunit type 1 TsaB [Myxococcota bacterium]|nr:tRNA (adenosine(37)-N6)-threonylcarbamoyltransferase complex dimerization subunit type 1 TsaB [Myxococcota bacterium]
MVLGIETGGFHLGVSLWRLPEEVGAPQASWHLLEVVGTRLGHQHARTLLAQVDAMLTRQGLTPTDIALIGVGRGPGGFTGIRVGMATAAGLHLGLDATVWPVDSLAVLARHAAGHDGVVVPLIDARKSEVYGAAYHVPLEGVPRRLAEPRVGPREDVLAGLSEVTGDSSPLVFGSGAVVYGGASDVPPSWHVPCAAEAAWLAATEWEAAGRHGAAAAPIDPVYVRPSDAELNAGS